MIAYYQGIKREFYLHKLHSQVAEELVFSQLHEIMEVGQRFQIGGARRRHLSGLENRQTLLCHFLHQNGVVT